jgi:serine/threonine-protein kinase RsbW
MYIGDKLGKKKYRKSFPSDPDLLPEIEDWIMEIAQEANLNEEKYNHLALSVAEASANSIVHGNKADRNIPVLIEVAYDSEQIEITFSDKGKGFKIDEVPDPTAPENILKDSGRGIHIMRSFLDDLKYKFSDDGTEVTLVLKLN